MLVCSLKINTPLTNGAKLSNNRHDTRDIPTLHKLSEN